MNVGWSMITFLPTQVSLGGLGGAVATVTSCAALDTSPSTSVTFRTTCLLPASWKVNFSGLPSPSGNEPPEAGSSDQTNFAGPSPTSVFEASKVTSWPMLGATGMKTNDATGSLSVGPGGVTGVAPRRLDPQTCPSGALVGVASW